MPEKPTKKTVGIAIKRVRQSTTKIIVANGFKLRPEKGTGLIEVCFEASGRPNERISLDPMVIWSNVEVFKRYAAGIAAEEDDTADREELVATEPSCFANFVHFSHMGNRAESIFGVFCISEWVEATRQTNPAKPAEITSVDTLVAISTVPVQKKLLLELVLLMSHQVKK